MRILVIGPDHGSGSIPPYLDMLTSALRRQGVHIDRLGSTGVPHDPATGRFWPAERIAQAAEALLHRVNLNAYDILSVHFGNLEVEQLIPALWGDRRRPPAVYHMHSLDWTLFTTHVPNAALRAAVEDSVRGMDGFVCFGTYGRDEIARRLNVDAPSVVSWLPTTIPAGTQPASRPALRAALVRDDGPVGTLYGYAAPWKDPAGLIAACKRTTTACRIVLAGPLWDDPHEADIDLAQEIASGVRHGAAHVSVVAAYLNAAERKALVAASDFAVFPYRRQSTFQGSGAIADYLAHGVPVVGTDVANMAELVGNAGIVVSPGDPQTLAATLDRLAADPSLRQALTLNARRRSRQFSAAHHAVHCLRLYEALAAKHSHASGVRP